MVNITSTDDAVIADVEIAAAPESVFAAITDPEQVVQWWGDDATYRVRKWEADLRVGGKYRSQGAGKDGQTFEVSGEYLEVNPPRVLAHTWVASYGGQPSVVRWELKPAGTGTRLRVTHSGFRGDPQSKTMYSNGWPGVLTWLAAYAQRKQGQAR
jgi:uncharacterized protein YndB with AHSA1/START domain